MLGELRIGHRETLPRLREFALHRAPIALETFVFRLRVRYRRSQSFTLRKADGELLPNAIEFRSRIGFVQPAGFDAVRAIPRRDDERAPAMRTVRGEARSSGVRAHVLTTPAAGKADVCDHGFERGNFYTAHA
jgi:hypothetical protein